MNKILPVTTLSLANQTIWLFDLKLNPINRGERRAVLDKQLSEFFTQEIKNPTQRRHQAPTENFAPYWHQLQCFSHIIHKPAQPAQAVFLTQSGDPLYLPLAISYALPYVAVAVTFDSHFDNKVIEKIGLDICAVADFEAMPELEKQYFCQDYFPYLPITHDSKALARRWSAFEATLKYHQLSLATAVQNPFFQQTLPPLSVQSDKVYLDEQAFWLSVAVA